MTARRNIPFPVYAEPPTAAWLLGLTVGVARVAREATALAGVVVVVTAEGEEGALRARAAAVTGLATAAVDSVTGDDDVRVAAAGDSGAENQGQEVMKNRPSKKL